MNSYNFFIEEWKLPSNIGLTQDERKRVQTLVVDSELMLDADPNLRSNPVLAQQDSNPRFMDYKIIIDYARDLAAAGFPAMENICFALVGGILIWPHTVRASIKVRKEVHGVSVCCSYSQGELIAEDAASAQVIEFIKAGGAFALQNWRVACALVLREYMSLVRFNEKKGGNLAPSIPWSEVKESLTVASSDGQLAS